MTNPIQSEIREKMENIILKVIYELKSVKSTSLLIEKVLEKSFEKKVTVSEKIIKMIINEMNNDKKIKFNQKEGWKIQI
jgi:hypothetical protein